MVFILRRDPVDTVWTTRTKLGMSFETFRHFENEIMQCLKTDIPPFTVKSLFNTVAVFLYIHTLRSHIDPHSTQSQFTYVNTWVITCSYWNIIVWIPITCSPGLLESTRRMVKLICVLYCPDNKAQHIALGLTRWHIKGWSQNVWHFEGDIFKCTLWNEDYCILFNFSDSISLRCVPNDPIDNKQALVQVMSGHRIGNKPLPGPTMIEFNEAIYDVKCPEWDYLSTLQVPVP